MDDFDKKMQAIISQKSLNLSTTSDPTYDQTVLQHRRVSLVPAVEVLEAHKHYGRGKKRQSVLRGLNMRVMKGEIYGLLGPSGCGKTTLLNIIIGRLCLDLGQVFVFGNVPGDPRSGIPGTRVGYMPQGLALYEEFTIYETLLYFSMLFRLKRKYLHSRMEFLLDLLCLPPGSRSVRSLSGGQQRRVSFAIAMLQEPELLILDEPTVGVDPLLRQNIWRHLISLAHGGKTTIIITTHYVEEAKQAHKVGMMRSGRLLAEEEPNLLISRHFASSLEEVFLELAIQEDGIDELKSSVNLSRKLSSSGNSDTASRGFQLDSVEKLRAGLGFPLPTLNLLPPQKASLRDYGGELINTDVITLNENLKEPGKIKEPAKKVFYIKMKLLPTAHRTFALLMKNTIKIYRNVGFLVFSFMIPTLQVCLFCLAIGGNPRNVPVAVYNAEVGTGNECTTQEIETYLSCNYIFHLNPEFVDLKYFQSNESAWDAAMKGDVMAILYFNKEFSKSLRERQYIVGVTKEVIENSWIRTSIDNSDQQTSSLLQAEFLMAYRDFVNEKINSTNLNPLTTASPIYFDTPIFGSENTTFTMFMAPGVILSITYFLAVGLTALSTILERKEGLMDRSYLAGVNDLEIMIAHTISHLFIMLVQIASVLLCMLLLFEIPAKGSLLLIILITVSQGLCGMANGLFISSVFDTEETAIQATIGSFYPNLLLSGVLWPLSAMPKYLRYISYFLPQTLPCETLRGLLLRGWELENFYIWRGFVVTYIWFIIFHIMSAIRLYYRR